MRKVAIIRCDTYEPGPVKDAVMKGIEILGGARRFVSPGEKILLKPNLLMAAVPAKSVTTHPSIFKAVAEIFQAAGAKLTYGDSPAIQGARGVAKKGGIAAAAEVLGIELADFTGGVEIHYEQGRQNKKFTVARGAVGCDGIISLPKLKSHAFQRYTGAIKNQFGCIPGIMKGEFHMKIPDPYLFAQMLVDLTGLLRPRLYVMDGISCMEGNGPSGGTPKNMNVILVSDDPVALDATACRLIGMNPEHVPAIKLGMESGLGTHREEEILIEGDDPGDLADPTFDIRRSPFRTYNYRRKGIWKIFDSLMVSKPHIREGQCVMCGSCIDACPVNPKALNWKDGDRTLPPVYDYDACIRCYCCQEVCPESAIHLRVPLLKRIVTPGKLKP